MTSESHCSGHSHEHGHSHGHTDNGHHATNGISDDNAHDTKFEIEPPKSKSKSSAAITDKERRQHVIKKLKTASILCASFFLVEVIGGILSGSLAVLSDAAHLAADLSAFVVAISGSHIASLPASETHTFGLKRTESLAALFSMTSLAILSMGLAIEALRRLWWILYSTEEATEVDGKLMALIAFIGVVVNVVLAFVLGEDHVHMPGGECGGGGGHDHSHGHSHGGGGCAGASHAKEQEQTSGHGHDHNHGDGGCDLHNDNNNANNNNGHSHDHNHGEGACDSHNAKNENDGHSHDHNHDEEAGNSHTHNEHSHNHNHNEESTSLLPSPTRASYSSITEVQHIDEVLPDDQSIACNSHTQAHDDAHARNVNLHATYLHVLADLAQSVVVFIAGLIIWWKPHWQVADPICTLIFSILVCWSTVGVIRSSLSVLLEEVPPGLNWEELYDAISQVDGVSNVHDLHIWSISHGNFILSVHANAENVEKAYRDVKKVCNKRNISHLTVQLQPNTMEDCVTCTEGSVHQCR